MDFGDWLGLIAIVVSVSTFFVSRHWHRKGLEDTERGAHFESDIKQNLLDEFDALKNIRKKMIRVINGAEIDDRGFCVEPKHVSKELDSIRNNELSVTLYEISAIIFIACDQYGHLFPNPSAAYDAPENLPSVPEDRLMEFEVNYDAIMDSISSLIAHLNDDSGQVLPPVTSELTDTCIRYEMSVRNFLNEIRAQLMIGHDL